MPTPVTVTMPCPREKASRLFINVDGATATYRCAGCEWTYTVGTQAPTGTTNATATAGVSTSLGVASGGASFTSGMFLAVGTGTAAEVVQVVGTATATVIPVPGGFVRTHNSGTTFGQLLLTPQQTATDKVPSAPGWGF